MSIFKYVVNGNIVYFETGRPLTGGVAHTDLNTLLFNLVKVTAPNVAVSNIANNSNTVLVSRFNVLNIASTIETANLNWPVGPTDGELVSIAATGNVTLVIGTVANASVTLPNVGTIAQGASLTYRYVANVGTGKWVVA